MFLFPYLYGFPKTSQGCALTKATSALHQSVCSLCSRRAAPELWSHSIESRLKFIWPEIMAQNIPHQVLFLTSLQSGDQWPPKDDGAELLVGKQRPRWLQQITRQQLFSTWWPTHLRHQRRGQLHLGLHMWLERLTRKTNGVMLEVDIDWSGSQSAPLMLLCSYHAVSFQVIESLKSSHWSLE